MNKLNMGDHTAFLYFVCLCLLFLCVYDVIWYKSIVSVHCVRCEGLEALNLLCIHAQLGVLASVGQNLPLKHPAVILSHVKFQNL